MQQMELALTMVYLKLKNLAKCILNLDKGFIKVKLLVKIKKREM